MTRVHDMGGRYGDGAVDPTDGAVFAKDWHARALAVTLAAGALGQWNIDYSRHARETLSPKDYARFSYYEKWLAGLADMLVAKGVITPDELRAGHGQGRSDLADRLLKSKDVRAVLSRGSPYHRPDDAAAPAAQFKPGDAVRTRKPARNLMAVGGHTRLPAYAAGMQGTIVLLHGAHVFPDANAHGFGEAPEPLYAVAIPARDLWGDEAGAGDEVVLDLWQSYLEPA